MKTLVVYDSLHGNTKQIAQAVGDAVGGEVKVSSVNEADPSTLRSFDLLFVGAPLVIFGEVPQEIRFSGVEFSPSSAVE